VAINIYGISDVIPDPLWPEHPELPTPIRDYQPSLSMAGSE